MTSPTLVAPALAPGVALLGEYQGSGFTEPHYLIVRADQQVFHVSRLLFVVASHLDGVSTHEEIAARVSEEYGRTLDADGVRFLVTANLRPMGIAAEEQSVPQLDPYASYGLPSSGPSTGPPATETSAPSSPAPHTAPAARPVRTRPAPASLAPAPAKPAKRILPRANPLLALRFRATLLPAR